MRSEGGIAGLKPGELRTENKSAVVASAVGDQGPVKLIRKALLDQHALAVEGARATKVPGRSTAACGATHAAMLRVSSC